MPDNRVIPAVNSGYHPAPVYPNTPPPNYGGGADYAADPSLYASNSPGIAIDAPLLEIVQKFIVLAFIVAGFLSAVFIFYGGISFILSGGNDEKIKKAVNTIRYAIIGLVITILSFTFVTIVGRFFNLDLLNYISWDFIKNSIQELMNSSATTGGSGYNIPHR